MTENKGIQRMTRQRRLLMEVLKRPNWHPTAEELYLEVHPSAPHLSLGTIYRNLHILAENNHIVRIDSKDAQQRYDGNTHPHFHVQCTGCGSIQDVHPDALAGPLPEIISIPGFKITGLRLLWLGLCERCQDSPPDDQDAVRGLQYEDCPGFSGEAPSEPCREN